MLSSGTTTSIIGAALYIMLNWSYTTAVFTNPGSTIEINDGYSSLPTVAPPVATSFTVKSTGELRFCKKCQARKPDRAHHCSTCRRCVLKMDHHCPWLATCVGLRNYKAFLLFLSYTTLFCFICFAVSGSWVWSEILSDGQYNDTIAPINNIMLAVIAGIIGIVLFAFTGWHILLAAKGQTTIECLEKTRYLSPLRQSMKHQHVAQHQGHETPTFGQQLSDIHTNALPGITRPEEGEVMVPRNESRGYNSAQSYQERERQQARDRYEDYLDEQDSERLPSAFDLGWRKNFLHLLGPRPSLWLLPIQTTTGDGWSWEASPKWLLARETIREDRERQSAQEHHHNGWNGNAPSRPAQSQLRDGAGRHYISSEISKADKVLGRSPSQFADAGSHGSNSLSMHTLQGGGLDEGDYDSSSDEQESRAAANNGRAGSNGAWNTASNMLGRPNRERYYPGGHHTGRSQDEGID